MNLLKEYWFSKSEHNLSNLEKLIRALLIRIYIQLYLDIKSTCHIMMVINS